jgi:LPXTG-motif cell wall-anchored protein
VPTARVLPRTGTEAGGTVLFALGCLLAGSALVLLARPTCEARRKH